MAPGRPVLVIAWGNPLREDDGAAGQVLEGLRSLEGRAGLPRLELQGRHQLTPDLAEAVSRAAGVVLVDARRGGRPGEVRREVLAPSSEVSPLAHSLSPQALLFLARHFFGRAPRAVLVTIAGQRFGVRDALSPAVRRAVPRAVRLVVREARALGASPARQATADRTA
jgi:hydrogenase maturation protease